MVFDVQIPSPRTQTSTLDTPERIIGDKAYGSDALDEVERTISWFQNFRRLCIRYEKSTMLFQGFLHQTGSGIASRKTEAPKLKEAHRYV